MPVGHDAEPNPGPGRRLSIDRVVEVYRPADERHAFGSGTGYLLDNGLVLTAAHVVGDSRTADVRFAWNSDLVGAEVVWRRYDRSGEGVDAALRRVAVPDSTLARLPSARWGRLVTAAACPVEVIGFPAALDFWREDRLERRDVAHVRGEILPGSRWKTGRYDVQVSTPIPRTAARPPWSTRRPSRWSGISGAAVCSGGLLVGVVVEDLDPSGRGLVAVPVESLLADPEFRDHVGAVPVRAVELDDVLERPVTRVRSPVGLLPAQAATVRFHGRDDIVAGFLDWCDGEEEFAVRLVTARAGEGKTRLAHELVERLGREGWCAGFLDQACADDQLRVLTELTEPLFLVVDYAEGRPGQVEALVRLMERGGRHARVAPGVRLVLLARATGGWWDGLRASTQMLRHLPPNSVVPLPELQPSGPARLAAFRDAVDDLCAGLATVPGYQDAVASVEPSRIVAPPLGRPRYGRALTVQMAALAALLQHLSPDDAGRDEPDEKILIHHETRFWEDTAPVHSLQHLHRATRRQLVAVATLCPVSDAEEALDLLAHLTLLSGETANTRTAVATWLNELYGSDGKYWDALVPDALGEYLAGWVGVESGSLLDDLARHVDHDQAESMLIVLCGAITPFPALVDNVVRYVLTRPRPMAFAAVAVAVRGDHPVLTGALDRLVASSTLDTTLAGGLLAATPRSTVTLARWAVRLAKRLVELHGSEPGDRRDPVSLAHARRQLAFRLAELGSHDEALGHAAEAVRLQRDAVEHGAEPDGLADALLTHAARLADLRRHDEAILVAGEAVWLSRELDQRGGAQADHVRLATALHHQAMWLYDLDRHVDAERVGGEAVRIRAHLADMSDHFLADLASSTHNYAGYLHDIDMSDEAVGNARAAVTAYRRLAEESPDAYQVLLGRALMSLTRMLAGRDPAEAVARAEEAVGVYRHVMRADTAVPLAEEFTMALANYGRRLSASGRKTAAINALAEVEELCVRLVASGSPDAADRLTSVRSDLANLRRAGGQHPGTV